MKKRRLRAGFKKLPDLVRQCEELLQKKLATDPDSDWSRASVSLSAFEKYENGSRSPSDETLALWFEVLKILPWYRDQIRKMVIPQLWHLDYGEMPTLPLRDDLVILNASNKPEAFLTMKWDLVGANEPFLKLFPGLEVGMNVTEWMLKSHYARLAIDNWEKRTHVLVAGIANIGVDIVPDEEIEAFRQWGATIPEFERMWTTDPQVEDVENSDVILNLPDGMKQRYITRTSDWIDAKRQFQHYILSLDPDWNGATAA